MSDLPPGYSDQPPGSSGPPGPGAPFESRPPLPPPGSEPQGTRARVRPPALLLLIVNVVNLLLGGLGLLLAFDMKSNPAESEAAFQQAWDQQEPKNRAALEAEGWTPQSFAAFFGNAFLWGGGLSVIIGVVGVLAAIRMMALRSFGISAVGAILTALPCVSPCLIIGQVAGIWALIVLFQNDVRSTFH